MWIVLKIDNTRMAVCQILLADTTLMKTKNTHKVADPSFCKNP